jgi:hypothetical protein
LSGPLQVLTSVVNGGHVGGLDMIWLLSYTLDASPELLEWFYTLFGN